MTQCPLCGPLYLPLSMTVQAGNSTQCYSHLLYGHNLHHKNIILDHQWSKPILFTSESARSPFLSVHLSPLSLYANFFTQSSPCYFFIYYANQRATHSRRRKELRQIERRRRHKEVNKMVGETEVMGRRVIPLIEVQERKEQRNRERQIEGENYLNGQQDKKGINNKRKRWI